MKLIIDSGSTKSDWLVIEGNSNKIIRTEGINPILQDDDTIRNILDEALGKIDCKTKIDEWHFYGAGVRENQEERLCNITLKLLSDNNLASSNINITYNSDILGASRALFQKTEGIACILGTGSNSCVFDGRRIIDNIPPLGYILGDEGSGSVLGRRFINAVYKRQLSANVRKDLEEYLNMSLSQIIEYTYRQPMANRFLASLAPFIKENLDTENINDLVIEHFRDFIQKNIVPYNRNDLSLGFIGSIAYHFEEQLKQAAEIEHQHINGIEKSPLNGLMRYHSSKCS